MVKGNAQTPQKFWDYQTANDKKQEQAYQDLGYVFSNKKLDPQAMADINAIGNNARFLGEKRWDELNALVPEQMKALDLGSFLQGYEEASQDQMSKITHSTRVFKSAVIELEALLFDMLPAKRGKAPNITPKGMYEALREIRDKIGRAVDILYSFIITGHAGDI